MGKKVQNYKTFCIWSERTQEDSFVLSLLFLFIHSFEIRASMKKPYKTVVINACIFCNSFLHSMYSQILYHRYFNYSSFSLCSTDNGFSMFRLKYRVTDSPWWIAEEKKPKFVIIVESFLASFSCFITWTQIASVEGLWTRLGNSAHFTECQERNSKTSIFVRFPIVFMAFFKRFITKTILRWTFSVVIDGW